MEFQKSERKRHRRLTNTPMLKDVAPPLQFTYPCMHTGKQILGKSILAPVEWGAKKISWKATQKMNKDMSAVISKAPIAKGWKEKPKDIDVDQDDEFPQSDENEIPPGADILSAMNASLSASTLYHRQSCQNIKFRLALESDVTALLNLMKINTVTVTSTADVNVNINIDSTADVSNPLTFTCLNKTNNGSSDNDLSSSEKDAISDILSESSIRRDGWGKSPCMWAFIAEQNINDEAVAEGEDEVRNVIGAAIISVGFSPKFCRYLRLETIVVNQTHRSIGVGSSLLALAMGTAVSLGVEVSCWDGVITDELRAVARHLAIEIKTVPTILRLSYEINRNNMLNLLLNRVSCKQVNNNVSVKSNWNDAFQKANQVLYYLYKI
jgi:hypothetical protein